MAKGASKSNRPAKAGKKSAAKKKAPSRAYDPIHSEELHMDGCGSGKEFDMSMATPDAELPPARGGVEMRRR